MIEKIATVQGIKSIVKYDGIGLRVTLDFSGLSAHEQANVLSMYQKDVIVQMEESNET